LNLHLALLIVYSVGVIGVGIWTARFVRSSSAFFVAGRSLGPGLILSSMLAANIGAGSTLGATGLAYRDGLSAWWWVGSAGIGSLIFGAVVAPRLWTLAKEHWGRGLATEGARRSLRYAFTEMDRDHVVSLIHPDNRASIRVAEHLGARQAGTAFVLGREVQVYRTERASAAVG